MTRPKRPAPALQPADRPPARRATRRWRPALAALLAAGAAGLAQAQPAGSGVTLYGLIDIAVGRFAGPATGVNAGDRGTWRVEGGGMSTSHFGLRGSEDLGGGLAAQFDLAAFFRSDTGAPGRSDAIGAPVNVGADPFWSRASWVGLSHRSWGRVRLGNSTTLLFVNSILANPFGDSTSFSPLVLVTHIGGPQSGGTGWTNQVVYDSPALAGATLSLARSMGEGLGGGNRSARLAWTQGPAAASLVWSAVRRNPSTFADGTSPNDVDTWMVGGSYTLPAVTLHAHLGRIHNRGTEAAPVSQSWRIVSLGASVPIGAGRLMAAWARRHTGDAPAPVPATAAGGNVTRSLASLGYDHFLSKRTDLYAVAMHDRTTTRTLPAPPTLVEASGTSFALGVRHRF